MVLLHGLVQDHSDRLAVGKCPTPDHVIVYYPMRFLLKRFLLNLLIISFLCFSGSSCKRKVSVPGGSIEQDGDQLKINTGDGGSFVAGGDVKLPEGFPDDVPQPSKTLQMAMKMPQGYDVAFVCKESQSDIFSKLQGEFKNKGWEETMATQTANGSVLVFKKGDTRHVNCSIGKSKDQTVIGLMISQR